MMGLTAVGSVVVMLSVFFFNDTATTEIYTLSLHDALPISCCQYSLPSRVNTLELRYGKSTLVTIKRMILMNFRSYDLIVYDLCGSTTDLYTFRTSDMVKGRSIDKYDNHSPLFETICSHYILLWHVLHLNVHKCSHKKSNSMGLPLFKQPSDTDY